MAARSKGKLVDDLITFLSDPMLEIPIKSFMDENCLLFDPTIAVESGHRDVFQSYGQLVKSLIESFCQDAKVTYKDAMIGINELIATREMREVFYDMTEPVLAATDFDIFLNVMTRHNILIQEQVLRMMLSSSGALPDSLVQGSSSTGSSVPSSKSSSQTAPAQTKVNSSAKKGSGQQVGDSGRKAVLVDGTGSSKGGAGPVKAVEEDNEEAILREVFSKSRIDEELATRMKNEAVRNVAEQNVFQLKRERTTLEEDMKQRVLDSKHVVKTEVSDTAKAMMKPAKIPIARQTMKSANDNMTATQAADTWLQSALSENHSTNQISTAPRSACDDSKDQISERTKFMREQRDKLLAMKKEERERQLKEAESGRPEHLRTTQAARRAFEAGQPGSSRDPSTVPADNEKKMAARRALAEKLRAEVVDI